jgi:glutathione S-transferase
MRRMPKLAVTYFDAPGRAEPIRIALHLAGLAFEDRRLKFPEFAELKAKGAFPLGSVPVLTVDDVDFPQTAAILRYVAKLGNTGLYPTDPYQALIVDAVLDTFNDTLSHAMTPSLLERDMTKKLEMRKALAAGPMTVAYGYAEKTLARSGGPFVAGATMSIADLVIAAQILQIRAGHLDGIGAEHLEPYPRLRAMADAYLADPRIVAYASAHAKH